MIRGFEITEFRVNASPYHGGDTIEVRAQAQITPELYPYLREGMARRQWLVIDEGTAPTQTRLFLRHVDLARGRKVGGSHVLEIQHGSTALQIPIDNVHNLKQLIEGLTELLNDAL